MKKILNTLAIALLFQLSCNTNIIAQNSTQARVDISKFAIMRAGINTGAKLYIGNSESVAIASLGNPTQRGTEFLETEDQNAVVLSYNSNKLYFVNNALVGYDIKDGTLLVGESLGAAFTIGSQISSLWVQTPAEIPYNLHHYVYSFYTYNLVATPGKSKGVNYKFRSTSYLKNGSNNLDGSLEVLFGNNERISNISYEE